MENPMGDVTIYDFYDKIIKRNTAKIFLGYSRLFFDLYKLHKHCQEQKQILNLNSEKQHWI